MTAAIALVSWGDITGPVVDLAAIAGTLIVLAQAVKIPAISRPLHWLWEKNVGGPLSAWVNRTFVTHLDPINHRLDNVNSRLDHGNERFDRLEVAVQKIDGQFQLNGGNSLRDRVEVTARTVGAPEAPGKPDDAED